MESDLKVAEELQQWAKTMGFVPGSKFVSVEEFPSPKAFQKICKGKVTNMWSDVIQHVRPKDEVLHIQKNLILQRLRSGKPLDKNLVRGQLGQQHLLAAKISEKEKERNSLLESIQKRESSIRAQEKLLRKSSHKSIELENQIDMFRKKQLLFKIKSDDTRCKITQLKSVADSAHDLCPPSRHAKPPATSSSDLETVLYRCVDALRDFHSKDRGNDLEVTEEDKSSEDLKHLWAQIKSNISGWGAQQIWDAFNSKLLTKLMEEISDFCGQDSNSRVIQSQSSLVQDAVSILPAKYMTSLLEYLNLETKSLIKKGALEKLQEDLILSAKGMDLNSTNLNKTLNAPEIIRALVVAQSKKAELSGKLQGIKAELARWKEAMSGCTTTSDSLKLAKEELASLDLQVVHDKKQIDENLAHMKMIACKLRSVHAKALANRRNFNTQVPSFFSIMKDRHCSDLEGYSISPGESKVRLTSTMIADSDSDLSFNTTCGSIGDKVNGQSNKSEALTVLKESISKEAKLFIKVHLESVPFIFRNGRKESVCDLMVQAPLMTTRSLRMPQRNFLQIVQGTPFMSTPNILLKQLYCLTQIRALHLYKAVYDIPVPTDPLTSAHFGALIKSHARHESDLIEKLEFVSTSLDDIESWVSKSNANFYLWLERPVQNAIPKNLRVNGILFSEWCKKYDDLAHQMD